MATQVQYGPRLIGNATDSLRSAILVAPVAAIESLNALPAEPNAIFRRALEQHGILVKTLQYFGVEVSVAEPSDEHALSVCANDLGVVFENGAILMRPSDVNRRPALAQLEGEFAALDVPIGGNIVTPGFLDGSDVLLAGATAFIGVSNRSNAIGRAGFAQIARANGYEPVEVKLDPRVPALRAVANVVASDKIVIAADGIDHAAFAGFELIVLERGEDLGAGFITLGAGRVLADMRYSFANRMMRKRGIAVESIDLYEFGKLGITPSRLVLPLKRA